MSKRKAPTMSSDADTPRQANRTSTPGEIELTTPLRQRVPSMDSEADHLLTPHRAFHSREEPSGTRPRKKSRNEAPLPTPTSTPAERPVQRDEPIRASEERELTADQDQEMVLPQEVYQERQDDGFLPGSIVRIVAKNFMTYNKVTINFSPHLNMVIGPNGCGKSTLVCALVVGLGYPNSVLARADKIKSFVQWGADEGSIETELKGKPNQANDVITVRLSALKNSRIFEINGRRVSLDAVTKLVKSYNIQVDNLCCFLPQENVEHFSRLDPVKLLKYTQQAAGHPRLIEWHKALIEFSLKKNELEAELQKLQTKKKELDRELVKMQADIDILKQRSKILDQMEIFKLDRLASQYGAANDALKAVKRDLVKLQATLREMENEQKPLSTQKEAFEKMKQLYQARSEHLAGATRSHQSIITKRQKAAQKALDFRTSTLDKLDGFQKEEKKRKHRLEALENELATLSSELSVQIEAPDLSQFEEELKSAASSHRATQSEIDRELQDLRQASAAQDATKKAQNKVLKELESLKNVSLLKEDALKRTSGLHDALLLQRRLKQENKFRGTVFEPVRLLISPKDQKFARAIEGCLSTYTLNTFICTDNEDYQLLAYECNEKNKYRVNIACLRAGDSLSNYQPSIHPDELPSLGFERYVIDLINGPEIVLAFLCSESKLHEIPVSFSPRSPIAENKLEQRNFPIKKWIVGDVRFTISFAERGLRHSTSTSDALRDPSTLNSLDNRKQVEAKEQELQRLQKIEHEQGQVATKLAATIKQLQAKQEDYSRTKDEITQSREAARAPYLEYIKKVKDQERKIARLEVERAKPSKEQRKAELETAVKEASLEHMQKVIEYKEARCSLSRVTTSIITCELLLHQNQNDANRLDAICQRSRQDLVAVEEELEQAEQKRVEMLAKAKKYKEKFDKAYEASSVEIQEGAKELVRARNAEGLQVQEDVFERTMNALKGELDNLPEIDSAVEEKYEQTLKEVDKTAGQISAKEDEKVKNNEDSSSVFALWKPQLDQLIGQVDEFLSAGFKKMNRYGRVELREDPDYGKWGIGIVVSFRHSQLPRRLDSLHSGGERSLTTLLYSISMTQVSKTPFCALDEINQGLDEDSELPAHNLMVEATCREATSQSFLFTPKLRKGLDYHRLMKVICVNNGEYLPSSGFNIGQCLEQARRKGLGK